MKSNKNATTTEPLSSSAVESIRKFFNFILRSSFLAQFTKNSFPLSARENFLISEEHPPHSTKENSSPEFSNFLYSLSATAFEIHQ